MDAVTRWRFTCPRGHTSWEAAESVFWCPECAANQPGVTGSFEQLLDRKSGEYVTPKQLQAIVDRG